MCAFVYTTKNVGNIYGIGKEKKVLMKEREKRVQLKVHNQSCLQLVPHLAFTQHPHAPLPTATVPDCSKAGSGGYRHPYHTLPWISTASLRQSTWHTVREKKRKENQERSEHDVQYAHIREE